MFSLSLPRLILAATVLCFASCASDRSIGRADRAKVRSVAVNYAPAADRPEASGSGGGRVAGRVARHGASIGLSALHLGPIARIGRLAMLLADVPGGSRKWAVSSAVLLALRDAGTDPLLLVARRTEEQIRRQKLFALDRANPDGVFHFELERATLDPVDKAGLTHRASLAVAAELRTAKGRTVWRKRLAARSGTIRTWQDYEERPSRLKTDFDGLAGVVARRLAADFTR